MDKKKVAVCVTLFAVVLVGAIVGTIFIKSEDGMFRLCYPVMGIITVVWISESVSKFYGWLIK